MALEDLLERLAGEAGTSGTSARSPDVPRIGPVTPLILGEKGIHGTSGTSRTSPAENACCSDTFEERAAILEFDGMVEREGAETLAAREQGFLTPRSLHAAAAARWAKHLSVLAEQEQGPRARQCIASALAFIDAGWAEKALSLGWTEIELVGADPQAPWERLDRRGAAYSELTVVAITAEHIVYEGRARRRRGSQADGAKIPWKLEKQHISDDAYG